jgi:hypothetical protein
LKNVKANTHIYICTPTELNKATTSNSLIGNRLHRSNAIAMFSFRVVELPKKKAAHLRPNMGAGAEFSFSYSLGT